MSRGRGGRGGGRGEEGGCMFLNKGGISRREMKKKRGWGRGRGRGGVILFSVL